MRQLRPRARRDPSRRRLWSPSPNKAAIGLLALFAGFVAHRQLALGIRTSNKRLLYWAMVAGLGDRIYMLPDDVGAAFRAPHLGGGILY